MKDKLVNRLKVKLIIGSVEDAIKEKLVVEESGINASRNFLQIETLLNCLELNNIDAAIGGARRDEEKSRAKERFFSHRNSFGEWDPKNQRPELWNLFNSHKDIDEHFRVFPISNWTEIDVWNYIKKEKIDLPSLYFSHERNCVVRNGVILSQSPYLKLNNKDKVKKLKVRFRTCGDMPITGAVESEADHIDAVINEVIETRTTERDSRADDKRGETSMEDRKKQGYF